MKVQELIDFINNWRGEDCYDRLYATWDVEESLPSLGEGGPLLVERGVMPEKHRWYTIATSVFRCEDGLAGVRWVDEIHSETTSAEDIREVCVAEEYEEYRTIAYRPKKKDGAAEETTEEE